MIERIYMLKKVAFYAYIRKKENMLHVFALDLKRNRPFLDILLQWKFQKLISFI
jgi:hypothetical protein